MIDDAVDDNDRRAYLKRHGINGFKISSSWPSYRMSELLDVLQRNYTLDYLPQGELCLFLLRRINYEKYCKQLQIPTSSSPTQTLKSSLIIDAKHERQQGWYLNEPTRSILMGSIFGILFVLVLLIFVILLITRCPYLFFCHGRASTYHQNNDSKSETLLVRPTPTNTIPWSSPPPPSSLPASQQHFYHHHHHARPLSYQPSLSTQCTCPTHYHSSGSTSTDASSNGQHGQNYHIYQEILNDDFNAQKNGTHYRTCRPLHIETHSPPTSLSTETSNTTAPPTNSEQCQLCSLSVLV